MRKIYLQNNNQFRKLYHKFYNLQKRLRELIQTGEFYTFSTEMRNRLIRRLKLLYERLSRTSSKQKIKWVTAAMALILSASIAKAGFTDPVSLSGFYIEGYSGFATVDLDVDGDLDVAVGQSDGTILYYQNDGGFYNRMDGSSNPFYDVDTLYYTRPTFGDVDGDGDVDLLVGHNSQGQTYYRNDEGTFVHVSGIDDPFDGFWVGSYTDPVLADVDGDGDVDLLIGRGYGDLSYFRNDEGTFNELTGTDNPFDIIDVGYDASPSFVDFDNDGDLDLFVGSSFGNIYYYRNDDGTFVEQTDEANPFNGMNFGYWIDISLVDMDDEGDADLAVCGEYDNFIHYYRNDADVFAEKRGLENPFEGIMTNYFPAPVFADIDGDADLDLIIGNYYGTLDFYEDTANLLTLRTGTENPFNGIDVIYISTPALGDLDDDDDIDLIVGNGDGGINYFENELGVFTEVTGVDNPFNGIDMNVPASPALVDFDSDGDLDMFLGGKYDCDSISYYKNDAGTYTLQDGINDPLDTVYFSYLRGLTTADIDTDGDMDLVVSETYGLIRYFNYGDGKLTEQTGLNNPFNNINFLGGFPGLADTDHDGDLDLYIGELYGKVYFSEFIPAGASVNPNSGLSTSEEGSSTQFSVVLDCRPADDVEIALTSSAPDEGTVDPSTLTFTSSDWDVPQTVTVTSVDDYDFDGPQDYDIDFAVTSMDPEYDGLTIPNISVTNYDDEEAGIDALAADAINVYAIDHTIMVVSDSRVVNTIKVFDITGQMILKSDINASGTHQIIVPGAHSGIYIVQTASEGEIQKTKVVLY